MKGAFGVLGVLEGFLKVELRLFEGFGGVQRFLGA